MTKKHIQCLQAPRTLSRVPETLFFIGLFFGLTMVLGCRESELSRTSGHVVVALSAPPKTLDPRYAIDATGSRVIHLLYQSLVRLGSQQTVIGDAAERWTHSGLKYVFFLKPGLRFSNGRELSEKDLQVTFEFFRGDKSPFASVMKRVKSFRSRRESGNLVFELELAQPTATFLEELGSIRILPWEAFENGTDRFVDLGKVSLGTGYFRWNRGNLREIILDKVDKAPLKEAQVTGVIFKTIQDDASRLMRVMKGDVDLVQTELPISKAFFLRKQPHLKVTTFLGPSTNYFLFNFGNRLLKNLKIRQAIAHAVDVDSILRFQLEGLAERASTILGPGNPYRASDLPIAKFDIELAKQRLEEGLREIRRELPAGEMVTPSLTLRTSADPETIEKARILSQQLTRIGLKVRVQSNEWGTFFSDVVSGRFEMALMRWVGVIDPDIYRQCFHSGQTPENQGRNRGRYSNAALDPLLDQSFAILDLSKRIKWAHDIQHRIAMEIPILPLWHEHQMVVVNQRIKGFIPSAMGDYLPLVDVEKKIPDRP
ncbi:MAG: ABC transporter substrate-binding protein [Bdellovibrionales bacterium]|nr:ABC transporter substrate-binding protein [Bdellovibrionales bacterium]